MIQTRFRQIARLEELAQPYLKRRRQYEDERVAVIRKQVFVPVANIALLILHGDPKIDEPLLAAWERCRESVAWQSCREKHGGFDENGGEQGTPFHVISAPRIARYFRKYFLPDLPGADETEKLSAVFEIAPPWLLWFTYGDVFARILGVKLPDLSSVNRFARGEFHLYELPDGPFECLPLPDGVYDKFEVSSQRDDSGHSMHMTSRERKRTLRIYENCGEPFPDDSGGESARR
jgi:hypothetical protein